MSYRMTDRMQTALGYDEFGNNPSLLCEQDQITLEHGNYLRVSGDAECGVCGSPYRIHPAVQGCLWLIRGCDGLVKL